MTVPTLPDDVAEALVLPTAVTEHQPSIIFSGRMIAVDISQQNGNTAVAAAESGGLFKTLDGGATWDHLPGLPAFRMSDVQIAPSDDRIILATTNSAGEAVDGAAIWRSVDGGATWTQPATADPPAGSGCVARSGAWGISFAPTGGSVYVATDCGIAVSRNLGATWTHVVADTTTGFPGEVAVVAQAGGIVDVCGWDGHHRSTDNGTTWTAASNALPPCFTNTFTNRVSNAASHAIAASPLEANVLWATTWNSTFNAFTLYESTNGGTTWTDLAIPTALNRPPFVRANRSGGGLPTQVDVYVGNGVNLYRQTCGSLTGTRCGGSFTQVTIDHADQTDVAWGPGDNCPDLAASDGGIHRTTDCGANFSLVGNNGGGLNALQIYDMAGQVHPGHTDLYFGTQDNNLWASPDGGASWPATIQFEGFFLQVPHNVPAGSNHDDQVVTGVACAGCGNFKSQEHFNGGAPAWNNPPGGGGTPFLIEEGVYIQFSSATPPETQLFLNTNYDAAGSWVNRGSFSQTLLGIPQIAGPAADPTIFQGYRRADGTIGLLRIEGVRSGGPLTVTQLDAGIGSLGGVGPIQAGAVPFASFCNGQGTFVCPTVFGVDPSDPQHLIAPDTVSGQMKESTDGGATWVVDDQLTQLLTKNGALAFGGFVSPTNQRPTQAHVIQWDPTNTDHIFVGTESSGIIVSLDGGDTWSRVKGSEAIPAMTSFVFDEVRNEIYASSYGRGMWKVDLLDADLRIGKTHRPEFPIAGDQLFYDFTVTNDGPDGSPQVQVRDELPPEVRFVSSTLPCEVGTPATGTEGERLLCQVGDLDVGESRTFTVKVAVLADTVSDAGGPTAITNVATVDSTSSVDPDRSNNRAEDTAIVEDLANVRVSKTCDDSVNAGSPARCTIFVDNDGPSYARQVVLTDEFSSNGAFSITATSASQGTCTNDADTVRCQLGDLAAATTEQPGRATVTVDVVANEPQIIRDVARARSDTPDPDETNNQASSSVSVAARGDLAIISMTDTPDPVAAGENLTWTVRVRNDGPSTAVNTVVEAAAPAGVAITSVTSTAGTTCTAGVGGDPFQPSTCGLGTLPPAAEREITVVGRVLPDTTGVLHVDGRVTSDTFDPNNGNNFAHTDTAVVQRADVATQLTATPNPGTAGNAATYSAVARNNGPSRAQAVAVQVNLPPEVTYVGASIIGGIGSCGQVAGSGDTIHCGVGDLHPGEARTIHVNVRVNPSAPSGATATGTSGVATATTDPSGGNNTATFGLPIQRLSDVSIVVTSPDFYDPSTTVRYGVAVANAGPSDAANTVATITLPPSKTGRYVSDTGGCTAAGNVLTCALGTLAAASTRAFVVDYYIVGNKKAVTTTGTVTSASPDPSGGNNSSSRTIYPR